MNKDIFNTSKYVDAYSTNNLANVERDIIDNYFIQKGFTLDLGCGTGRTTINLYNKGFDVMGIDIAENMIDRAIARHPHLNFQVRDATKLYFSDDTFDNILFSYNGIDAIYPKEQRLKALREIYRVLKPSGVFAFSSRNSRFIPNSPGRIRIWLKNLVRGNLFRDYRVNYQKSDRLVFYNGSIASQVKDLENVGFTVKEILGKKNQFIEPCPYYICTKNEKS